MSEHVAGRDLDALVAEKVMGRKVLDGPFGVFPVPAYSTDIAAAFEVVEKMRTTGWAFSVDDMLKDKFHAVFRRRDKPANDDSAWAEGLAPSTPLAICLAALSAIGEEAS